MPAYAFEALDDQGQPRKGVLQADSARAARQQLRSQALIPLAVTPAQPDTASGLGLARHARRRVFTRTELTIWTRQLAGLTAAGLPLERALGLLADEAGNDAQRQLCASLHAEVNAGAPLAQALAQHPREFSEIYTAVIAAGEQSGALGTVLERLADDLEERQALRSKLVGAALYPAIVSLIALAIVLFLMAYVVPQIAQVFTGTQRPLPLLTVVLLRLSAFVRDYGLAIALLLGLAASGLMVMLKDARVRLRWDAAWLRVPLVGPLLRGYHSARFAATLAMLSAAGVPILKSLHAAAATLGNRALRHDAEQAVTLVREGAPLALALAQPGATAGRFPGLLPLFIRLGEQTGQLPQMLQRAAQQLGNDVQRRAMQLATVLEPLLIVVMGLVVMLIVLAVLLPIIQMNQWVR